MKSYDTAARIARRLQDQDLSHPPSSSRDLQGGAIPLQPVDGNVVVVVVITGGEEGGDEGGEDGGDEAGVYPVPVSVTVWTPLPSLPSSSHVAVAGPSAVGENSTVSSIEVFGAIMSPVPDELGKGIGQRAEPVRWWAVWIR